LAAALLCLVVFGCSVAGPTRASLSQEDVAKLHLAGSVELIQDGGHDSEQTPEGQLAAIAWREYGVNSSWDNVVTYFDREMRGRGWQAGGGSSGARSTQELDVAAWHIGDRTLRLAHRRNATRPNSGSFTTIYTVTLIGQGLPSE
jgi:hypothetical protein